MALQIYQYAILLLTTGITTATAGAQFMNGNAVSSPNYEILNVHPNNNSDTTVLPCWNRTAGRSGRITLKRKHFLNSPYYKLSFQLPLCSTAASFFSTNRPPLNLFEDLYIDVRAGQLDLESVNYRREFITVLAQDKINSLGNYDFMSDNYGSLLETMTASNGHFHALLRQKTGSSLPFGFRPAADFAVYLSRDQFSFFNSSNNFGLADWVFGQFGPINVPGTAIAEGLNISASTTFEDLNDPVLMEKDFLTIDYTVTLRQLVGSLPAAEYLQENNITDMYYCTKSRGFVPKSLCLNFLQNSLSITACPRVVSIGVSTSPMSPTMESSECLDLPTAIWYLTSATTPSIPTRTTTRPFYTSDRYDYTRLWVGMGVSLGILLMMCCCGICRHVFKDCYRGRGGGVSGASAEDGTRRLRTSSPGLRETRTVTESIEMRRQLDAPPSYDDVVRAGPALALVPNKESECDLSTLDAGPEIPVSLSVTAPSSRSVTLNNSES